MWIPPFVAWCGAGSSCLTLGLGLGASLDVICIGDELMGSLLVGFRNLVSTWALNWARSEKQ